MLRGLGLVVMATVLVAMISAAGAADFKCGKTFVTFHAWHFRENGTGDLPKLHTVRKAHILQVRWVPPKGPPFVEVDQPRRSKSDILVLNRVEDWSRLVECLD